MLQYGFIVADADRQLSYDHYCLRTIRIPKQRLEYLVSDRCPNIASRDFTLSRSVCRSPIFKYTSVDFCDEHFQSAFYALDTLTNKNVIPVYIPETLQVKDLRFILNDNEQEKFNCLHKYLRDLYVKVQKRHPIKNFCALSSSAYSASELELSEEEVRAMFGRLPEKAKEMSENQDINFIPDGVRRYN